MSSVKQHLWKNTTWSPEVRRQQLLLPEGEQASAAGEGAGRSSRLQLIPSRTCCHGTPPPSAPHLVAQNGTRNKPFHIKRDTKWCYFVQYVIWSSPTVMASKTPWQYRGTPGFWLWSSVNSHSCSALCSTWPGSLTGRLPRGLPEGRSKPTSQSMWLWGIKQAVNQKRGKC